MPVYNYVCERCGGFETARPIAESAVPQPCPLCGQPALRELATPHVRGQRAAIRYVAGERNEKSANEPAIEHRLKGTTEHHHRHGRHGHRDYAHMGRPHRPWMIGH